MFNNITKHLVWWEVEPNKRKEEFEKLVVEETPEEKEKMADMRKQIESEVATAFITK